MLTQAVGQTKLIDEADCWPQAQHMLPFALAGFQSNEVISADQVEPVYIRDKVAKSLSEQVAEKTAKSRSSI